MKLKYIGSINLQSQGISFSKDNEYEVLESKGQYLLKTFGSLFEEIKEDKKVEEKPVEEVKETKAKPKAK